MNYQWYPGHMTKARRQMQEDLKLIDLMIELVDARVPAASRNPDIDELGTRNFHTCTLNLVLPSPPLYPRASIAVAKSSARLKEDTNNGISIGITAFTCSTNEPSPKLTPLER